MLLQFASPFSVVQDPAHRMVSPPLTHSRDCFTDMPRCLSPRWLAPVKVTVNINYIPEKYYSRCWGKTMSPDHAEAHRYPILGSTNQHKHLQTRQFQVTKNTCLNPRLWRKDRILGRWLLHNSDFKCHQGSIFMVWEKRCFNSCCS